MISAPCFIKNYAIDGRAGNDSIESFGYGNTIQGGTGDDTINISYLAWTPSSGSSSTTKSGSSTSTVGSGSSSNKSLTPQVRIYTGGDQIISDYQSGEQIFLGTMPTGYIFGDGNFAMTSATGTLFIANDKIINFVDGAGNDFAKAYAMTNPSVIDGRGLAGYEVINGSDYGADAIFAGDGGSQLWGGNGVDSARLGYVRQCRLD